MPAETAQAEVADVSLASMSQSDRNEYLATGKLPGEKTQSEGTAQAEATSGAVSDTAEIQEPPVEEPPRRKSREQRRFDKLTAQIKQLQAQLAEKSGTERPRASEAVASTSKAPKLKAFTDQIGSKFQNWEAAHDAYEDATDAFYTGRSAAAVKEAIQAERDAQKQTQTQLEAAKATEKNAKTFAKRAEEFRATLPEDNFMAHFVEVKEALDEVIAQRPEWGQVGDLLVESEVGPQLIQYFGQNPEEWDALLDMPLNRALIRFGQLEVSADIKAPAPKNTTKQKRIGTSVAGRASTALDRLDELVEKDKGIVSKEYIELANARDRKRQ